MFVILFFFFLFFAFIAFTELFRSKKLILIYIFLFFTITSFFLKALLNAEKSTLGHSRSSTFKILSDFFTTMSQLLSNKQVATDTGDITIPVYIGNTAIDEIIVTAQQRRTMRSGGKS